MGTANGGEVSYAGNNSATMLFWGPQLEKGSSATAFAGAGVQETMTDPLNGWTGTFSGNLGKRPTISGDGFAGGSMAFSVTNGLIPTPRVPTWESEGVMPEPWHFGCM